MADGINIIIGILTIASFLIGLVNTGVQFGYYKGKLETQADRILENKKSILELKAELKERRILSEDVQGRLIKIEAEVANITQDIEKILAKMKII